LNEVLIAKTVGDILENAPHVVDRLVVAVIAIFDFDANERVSADAHQIYCGGHGCHTALTSLIVVTFSDSAAYHGPIRNLACTPIFNLHGHRKLRGNRDHVFVHTPLEDGFYFNRFFKDQSRQHGFPMSPPDLICQCCQRLDNVLDPLVDRNPVLFVFVVVGELTSIMAFRGWLVISKLPVAGGGEKRCFNQ
jgi:hypothetical protein